MTEFLQRLSSTSVLLFTVCSMLSVGFAYSVQEILAPLRQRSDVVRALVANFVLVPGLAVLITRILPLAPGLQTGLILLGCAAGAPFLIKLTQKAQSDVGLGATLLVLLVPVSVVFMPFAVPALAPEAHVRASPIARQLLLTLMVPLGLGLVVKALAPPLARTLRPVMNTASTVALGVLFATTVVLHLDDLRALGLRALVAALLLILGSLAIGYGLARPGRGRRRVLGLGTAQRGIAAAAMVASQSIPDPDAFVMVVVTMVTSIVVLFPIAHLLRKPAPQPWLRDEAMGSRLHP